MSDHGKHEELYSNPEKATPPQAALNTDQVNIDIRETPSQPQSEVKAFHKGAGPVRTSAEPISPLKVRPAGAAAIAADAKSRQSFSGSSDAVKKDTPVIADEISIGEGGAKGEQHHALNFGDDQGDEPTPENYDPTNKWWSLCLESVFQLVQLEDPTEGLDANDVPRHAQALGDNLIPIKGGAKWYWVLARQFLNAITVVLVIVAVISGVFEDWAEFGVVVAILIFNAALGFYQEWGAEKSLESLKEMTAGVAKVMRNGTPEVIFVDEVVVGDVIILEQGSSVPADCRVFESNSLEIDEALLTGEALPVVKHANVIPDPDLRCALGDRKNMAFRNTEVTQGRGKAVVVCGGVHTEMGKLADRLGGGGGGGKTPLMKKLDYMMYFLFGCCIILAIVVFAANKMKYTPATLSYATAVAIAILPESLIVVITVAMTVAVKKMAQKKCLVRKLTVLEVLGGVTDICSDKTGTLTENKMVVKKAVIGTDDTLSVAGAPYEVHGDFFQVTNGVQAQEGFNMSHKYDAHQHWREFMRCGALCSTTILHPTEEDMDVLEGNGNPTEIAIQVMTWKAHLNRDSFIADGWECICEYAFDSSVKRMSTTWFNAGTNDLYICTKGAPERVLALCNYKLDVNANPVALTAEDRANVEHHIGELAAQGLRTLCLSYRRDATALFPVPKNQPFGDVFDRDQVEQDLTYLGIVGIYDPPRPESRPSVIACQHAGIAVRMLTGDHTSTAGSIASMLNIISRRDLEDPVKLQAGPDFDKVDPDVIDGWADLPYVIGRCSPESKVKMIESLHRRKKVVAMTGDGFNDSPSIKIADVGCAMGSGVDVTKGVADLVITDDNFSTIVKAVAEGRRVQQCIKKFVVHLLSSNVAEVIALICGLPIRHENESVFVLSPVEILWLNLLTSGPPAMGLSMDKATSDILQVPPNTTGFFTVELIFDTVVYGFWLGVCTLCSFVIVLYGFSDGPSGTDCNTRKGKDCNVIWSTRATAFGVLYFGLFLHAYTVRHPRMSIFKMKWFDNKWLWGSIVLGTVLFFPIIYIVPVAREVFQHYWLTWHWAVLAVAVIVFIAMSELYKVLKNCIFPIRKVMVHVDQDVDEEADQDALEREYNTFTRTESDNRDIQSIAEENLRMSFASFAETIGSAPTGSFRMPNSGQQRHKTTKKKSRNIFRRR